MAVGKIEHVSVVAKRLRNTGEVMRHCVPLIRTVDEERGVTAVVDDDIKGFGAPVQHLVRAPPVLFKSLTLPGEHRGGISRDRRGGVVLRGEDVARAPPDDGAEGDQGFDEHRGLDGHVKRTRDVGALQRLGGAELLDHGHEAGHLDLRELDLEATVWRVFGTRRMVRQGTGRGDGCCVVWRNTRDSVVSFRSVFDANETGPIDSRKESHGGQRCHRRRALKRRTRSIFFPDASEVRTYPKSAMAMSLTLYSRPLTVSMEHIAVGADIFADVMWG